MTFESVWDEIRQQAESLNDDSVFVTPASERAFVVDHTTEERIDIWYRDSDEKRTLWRDQFAVLYDRMHENDEGISLSELPLGVEPYVSVLSLCPQYTVDESADVLRQAEEDAQDGTPQVSPFIRESWQVRTMQERVHDDALLVTDILERYSLRDLSPLPSDTLVDVYVLLSDVQRGADRLRRTISEELLGRIGPDDRLHGQFGTVNRTRRERHHLKDPETIFAALDSRGIPREWVIGVDPDKLDVVLAATDLTEDEVYDVEDQVYVQKTNVEEDAKRSRLTGLADRLAPLDTEEAEELRQEIETLETRLNHLLAAG